MFTVRIAPDLEMHYLVDVYTDPWRAPETILLLHGNCESGAAWFAWVPHLARSLRVVRPDMRGYGASTPVPRGFPWSLDVVITTEGSGLASVEETRAWQIKIPRSRLLVLPGDSYHVAASDADRCARETLDFITRAGA